MSENFFQLYAETLAQSGFEVLPIKPGTKGCFLEGWPHRHFSLDEVQQMAHGKFAKYGVGINARYTPAVDVDVLDSDVAQAMSDAIDALFPDARLMARTGQAPKFLVPFRASSPFRKITSSTYIDAEGRTHKIEILGEGQQWVGYLVHPGVRKPYEWWDGVSNRGILEVRHDDLPVLTQETASRIVAAFERIAQQKVESGEWRVKEAAQQKSTAVADDLDAHAPTVGFTYAQGEELAKRLPNDDADYEAWLSTLCAFHHEYGEDGEDLALQWSQKSPKHDHDKFQSTWESLGRYTGRQATLRTLIARLPKEQRHFEKPEQPSGKKFQVHDEATYQRDFSSVSWLVKNVIPHAEFGAIYGASGSGKTFFALDLAYTIARGEEWRGLKTRKSSRVIYVASEASRGIKKRLAAYNQVNGYHGGPGIVDEAPDLQSMTQAAELAEAIGQADLIILDTMAASQSGDENSAKDMGIFIACCKHIAQQTGAMVLVVHHSGNSNTDRMRGSSALFAAADVVLEVSKREDGTNGVVVTKQKDGETGEEFGFRLRQVKVGTDADNEPITSCVLEQREDAAPKATLKDNGGNFDTSPTYRKARWFLQTLTDMTNGEPVNVKLEELYEALELFAQRDNVTFRARDSANTLRTLEAKGKIVREGPWVRLCGISREECEDLAKS